MHFTLRDRLRYCIADDRAIFMDLSTGRYFCLERRLDAAFRSLAAHKILRPGDEGMIHELLVEGLLVHGSGDPLKDWPAPPSSSPGVPAAQVGRPRIPLVLFAVFHQLRARFWLWRWPIHRIVEKLDQRAALGAIRPVPFRTALPDLAAAFRKTDLIFPPFEQCLPRSLAFVLLCAAFGIRTSLTIGVRSQPFAAHAWVEDEVSVIMDDLDAAANFTPILRT